MKKIFLIAGIVMIAAAVLFLSYAGLNLFGYYRVLDGSAQLYRRLHQRAIIFGAAGIISAFIGAACLLMRSGK